MSTVIYSCGHDENGKYKGGKAGDQTKTEWYARADYFPGWTAVYEPPTPEIGKRVAAQAKAGSENNNCGYDQNQRNTLRTEAKKTGWNLAAIKTPCEADCSSSTAVCVVAAGGSTDANMMNGSSNCPTTSTIGARLVAAGWKEHKTTAYLNSSDLWGPGWVVNRAGHHVIINGTAGKKYNSGSSSANSGGSGGACPYAEPSVTLKKGSKGTGVSWLQWHLNTLIDKGIITGVSRLSVDDDWGSKTEAAFKAFQTKYPSTGTNNKPDGKCGGGSRRKLKSLVA
ncbi:peptidoglycan-binding domain-containing protein [Lacrimispora indolis]|uniref:peptidoglycan-binding domain-containing protein n=1 Tax=Lacrimispora indolis TaxID=69825 RepID=UPI000401364A|nr:peptidoglycan-binding domain-containing protein [[Clostridium] methoxybenzovorans]